MWADAKRDGRPVEYRLHPLLNAAKFGWRLLLQCRAVRLPMQENAKLGRKVNFPPAKFRHGARAVENIYIVYQSRRRPKIMQSSVGLR